MLSWVASLDLKKKDRCGLLWEWHERAFLEDFLKHKWWLLMNWVNLWVALLFCRKSNLSAKLTARVSFFTFSTLTQECGRKRKDHNHWCVFGYTADWALCQTKNHIASSQHLTLQKMNWGHQELHKFLSLYDLLVVMDWIQWPPPTFWANTQCHVFLCVSINVC